MTKIGQRLIKAAKEAREMIRFDFEDRVDAYCQSERQWLRPFRIQRAEYCKKIASSDEEKQFWNAVLKRMRDENDTSGEIRNRTPWRRK